MSKIVTYDDLRENPAMLTNPELVIRIGHKYYNWLTAAPIIMSQIVFQKSLPDVSWGFQHNENMSMQYI